jgi:peptide/nickel transport system substrate-binding protein
MAIPSVPNSLDPQVPQGNASNDTYSIWVSTLIQYANIGADPAGLQGPTDIVGELAESWVRNDDGSYTITLRSARSAAGNEVTSEDVSWSFERAKELDPIAAFLYDAGNFDTDNLITVIDDKTFTINVTAPSIVTLRTLIPENLPVLDSTEALKYATDEDPWASEWLAGNIATFGPYTLDSFTPGEEIRLRANENYWGGPPAFTEVLIRAIPDSSTRLQLLTAGEIDFAGRLSARHFTDLQTNPDVNTIISPTAKSDVIFLRHGVAPFNDPRVRKAIALAIDRGALVQAAYENLGTPSLFQIDSRMPYPGLPASTPYSYDPDAARALLADAGLADGFSFELVGFNGRPGPQAEPIAILVKTQLAEIGIDVTINMVASSADYNAGRAKDGPYVAWIDQYLSLVPDPSYHVGLFLESTSIYNLAGYANARVDELVELTTALEPGAERDELLIEMVLILQDEAVVIPLVEDVLLVALGSDIGGYYPVANLRLYPHRLQRQG